MIQVPASRRRVRSVQFLGPLTDREIWTLDGEGPFGLNDQGAGFEHVIESEPAE
jgi:hypothetical protein